MLVCVQLPQADLRRISGAARLAQPGWPDPAPFESFVRGFGQVVPSGRGGAAGWMGEYVVCVANRTLRLPSTPLDPIQRVLYRRFFSDGSVLCKWDIGFRTSPARTREELEGILRAVATVRAEVRCPTRVAGLAFRTSQLVDASPALAETYLHASTPRASQAAPGTVLACRPGIFVEIASDSARRLSSARRSANISVSRFWLKHAHSAIPVWLLERPAGATALRSTRLAISRYHAGLEEVRAVLAFVRNKPEYQRGSPSSDFLQRYLLNKERWLRRVAHSLELPLDTHLTSANDANAPAEAAAIRERVDETLEFLGMRRAVATKARWMNQQIIRYYYTGDIVMGHKLDARGAHGVIGLENAIGQITNSFNQVSATVSDPLREALDKLRQQVEELSRALPASAEQIARDYSSLSTEAAATTPRLTHLQMIADAIATAARGASALAIPIAQTLKLVVALATGT